MCVHIYVLMYVCTMYTFLRSVLWENLTAAISQQQKAHLPPRTWLLNSKDLASKSPLKAIRASWKIGIFQSWGRQSTKGVWKSYWAR